MQPSHPSNSARIAVRATGLIKSFANGATRTEVLKGVDLVCKTGEILMIVGPSGCGKTTLLSCIAGTLAIDRGNIEIFGQEITTLSANKLLKFRGRHLGFIFQLFNLIPTLNLIENVALPLLIHLVPEEIAFSQAEKLLDQVGLSGKGYQYPREISGGQQQRVAIARALVHAPDLVLCDEPTSALDGKTGITIVELLKKIAQDENRAVVIVTHDSRIFHFADRIVEMEDGRIVKIYDDIKEFTHKSF